jgi:hypothetical protein
LKIGSADSAEAQQVKQEGDRYIQIIKNIIGEGEQGKTQVIEES